MTKSIADRLLAEEIITTEQHQSILSEEKNGLFSLNKELKTLLYLGVLLLSAGIGLLVYLYIDTIGHQFIIALIAAITFGAFYYAYRISPPFSPNFVKSPSPFADYSLVLGCLTFLTLEGYLQFQYNLFGEKYGLATFIPAVLFFFLAYRFDNRGVLSMAITALASWVGINTTPRQLLDNNDFSDVVLIRSAWILGLVLIGGAAWLKKQKIKEHFTFTYLNFGGNMLFIATLSGMFLWETSNLVYAGLLFALCALFIVFARRGYPDGTPSLYFLLISVLYGYIGLTYLIFSADAFDSFEGGMMYFILSCAGVILFFLNYKKLLKPNTQPLEDEK